MGVNGVNGLFLLDHCGPLWRYYLGAKPTAVVDNPGTTEERQRKISSLACGS